MKQEKDKQTKKIKPTLVTQLPEFNNVEAVKIGELQMASEVLRADELLALLIASLENKNVKNYLNVIEKKKMSGAYLG